MHLTQVLIVSACIIASSYAYIVNPGPVVKASVGKVVPKPLWWKDYNQLYQLDPRTFKFEVSGHTCDILEKAITRYNKILIDTLSTLVRDTHIDDVAPVLNSIKVNLTKPCELKPYLNMDENYYVVSGEEIGSNSIWGILRGMETFSQLAVPSGSGNLQIRSVKITDGPRFPHRGFLFDTSRHFMSMDTIYKVIDGLAYNKFNVFHWHIIDDHAFPYKSIKFPELAEKGAYMPQMTYSQEDVANIIEYCRLRGIRVLIEVDVPGHTRSWGNSHPEVLTQCEGSYEGQMGPVNPISETAFKFVTDLIEEMVHVFPDEYIHLGGDEVGFECWESNSAIRRYIYEKNITFTDLQRKFMERVTNAVSALNEKAIVWQEAMVDNVKMAEGTIVQVWTGNWRSLLQRFTAEGHRVLMSECWYLDHLLSGGDWQKFYRCEPLDFIATDEQKELVIGGEACMWSEVVSDRNVLQRIFPRISAAAERLWSHRLTTNLVDAQQRLEEHTCRMVARGIPAQPPNGPGFC